jgi:vacuolar protein sorting-associated protein 13A/C
MDEFFADDNTKVYWVSFLDGLQRVLLFTEDLAVAVNAQEVSDANIFDSTVKPVVTGRPCTAQVGSCSP